MTVTIQNQIVGKKLSVTDELLLLNPHQTPMISFLGFSDPVTQVEHQWFEDEMYADKTTATAATAAATSITVADGSIFEKDYVVKVGEELMLVTAVAGNVLTVTRGYAGTTAAAVTEGADVEFQFAEGVEGADARKARYKSRVRKSNLSQIFTDTISISGTAAVTSQYSIDDLYEYEKQKKLEELAYQLEKSLIGGVKYESADGKVRQTAGLRSQVVTNVITAGGPLSEVNLGDAFQAIYEAGGFATGGNYKIIVGAKQKRALSALDKNQIQLERQDNGRGQVVDFFLSDFGAAEVLLNNNLAPDELYIVDANRINIRPLNGREFAHTYLGTKGDYIEGQIVGEYMLEVQQEKAHARIKGLA